MEKNNNQLFERQSDEQGFINYVKKIKKQLNYENFANIFHHPKNLYEPDEFIYYERYIFCLLKIWAMENEEYSSTYLEKLNFLIRKYNLKNRLFLFEVEYLNLFAEVVFNSKRNLKNIVVDFPTLPFKLKEEEIFYHFIDVNFKSEKTNNNGDVFITNWRIVLSEETTILTIPFSDIDRYKLTAKGICINAYNKLYYFEPQNDDPRVFYVSFERIYYGNNQRKNN